MSSESGRLVELEVGGDPERWRDLGFTVDDSTVQIGTTRLALSGDVRGIAGWTLAGVPEDVHGIDGLPTGVAPAWDPAPPPEHPNGALSLDHVVVFTPSLERTTAAIEPLGIRCRRVREGGEGLRQGFFRLGEVILEVVEGAPGEDPHEPGPARFWGLVVVVPDLDRAAALLGPSLGRVKDAVQPGRRIATVRLYAADGLPLAFITPQPPRAG